MKHSKKKAKGHLPVLAALIGNIFITILKFIGASISGSTILFSEAIHSLADVFNQVLLFIGIVRSKKAPDANFIYGYGHERFFWALVSACGVFFMGAGVTMYSGIHNLFSEKEVMLSQAVYIILFVSFVVEFITFLLALREMDIKNKGGLLKAIKHGDPSTLAVFYEDGVAVIGVVVAILSITLVKITGYLFWDSVGSIIIGLLLGTIALILINKNRTFLIEKSIPLKITDGIVRKLGKDPMIEKVIDFKSSILDIDNYRIKCEVEINGSVLFQEAFKKKELKAQHKNIKDDYDEFVKFCADYADQIPRIIGKRIDLLEREIKEEIPNVKHIDIEIN